MLIIPVFCICASTTITTLHLIGWYEDINERLMWIFDFSTLIYLFIGIYFFRTGFGEDGIIKSEKLRNAKITILGFLLIQWNAISYVWPFSDFWAYCVLFTIVLAFFFDEKYVAVSSVCFLVSLFLSWYLKGGRLLPEQGAYFNANIVFRLVGIILMMGSINIITYFGGKYLVEELEKYANYDTLTRLLNRRSMDNYLEAAYRQAQTGKASFCLLMADIDDFKKVNDTYGHDCGDEVLKYVAQTITTGVKKSDNVFRWGGEEICILLNADEDRAVQVAERIRKDIESDPVNYRDEALVFVTVTMGVSPYRDGMSIQTMMDDADAKLYWGKKHGKNQVVSVLPEDPDQTKKDRKSKKDDWHDLPVLKFSLQPHGA